MSGLREALEALCAKHEHGATRWQDPLPVPEWIPLVRGILAAHPAEPAPVANRERVAEVLRGFSNGEPVDDDGWVLFADDLEDFANALLAAGVFRDEAAVKAEAFDAYAEFLVDDETAPHSVVKTFEDLKARAKALRAGAS